MSMPVLAGPDGFAALQDVLRGAGDPASFTAQDVSFERLRRSLIGISPCSPLDRAVLLRHALRYEACRRASGVAPEVTLRYPHLWPDHSVWGRLSMAATSTPQGTRVSALPWHPTWLAGADVRAVDATAAEAPQRRFFQGGGDTRGDPFLSRLGLRDYRSRGQRAAVRAALSMPPGAALCVELPTGEGKSTVFRAIDRIGFAADRPGKPSGVTLVVVPTVTLALDHESAASRSSSTVPRAYVGGREAENAAIRDAVRSGRQGLCFAGPEAVYGPLAEPLREAASQGLLRAIVIDEAHLVDGWGTAFRTEFQLCAGLRRGLLDACPEGQAFRTVLLSATLTERGRDTLADLFAAPDPLCTVSIVRTRPEPEYWPVPSTDRASRDARLLEALRHLPRPAIIYVTEREDAKALEALLWQHGFRNLARVDGETQAAERERVVKLWGAGVLDVVVGTSAFGLGIDYAHARTVIHACVPESFDRFYQEVGRTGRDGRASVSLILPTAKDFDTARSLAAQKVITVERGLERWQAMFEHPDRINLGHPRYGIRIDVLPGDSGTDLDLFGERNTDWNARTLTLMARAGLVRLTGLPAQPHRTGEPPDKRQFVGVEILDDRHLSRAFWDERVESLRHRILADNSASLTSLLQFLQGKTCPSDVVARIYPKALKFCSGCGLCRHRTVGHAPAHGIFEVPSPWPLEGKLAPALRTLAPGTRLVVGYDVAAADWEMSLDRWPEAVELLDLYGIRQVLLLGEVPEALTSSLEGQVRARPWVVDRVRTVGEPHLARGAKLVLIGDGAGLPPRAWLEAEEGHTALVLVQADTPHPDNPRVPLRSALRVPYLSFSSFINRFCA